VIVHKETRIHVTVYTIKHVYVHDCVNYRLMYTLQKLQKKKEGDKITGSNEKGKDSNNVNY
jgi:hypothetical protein